MNLPNLTKLRQIQPSFSIRVILVCGITVVNRLVRVEELDEKSKDLRKEELIKN